MSTALLGAYEIPQEHRDFQDLVRRIARERVAPRAAEIDATDEYPWDLRRLLAEQDLLALPFAEEHGGTGTGTLMLQIAVEELAKASAAVALILMVQELGIHGSPTGTPVFDEVRVPDENRIGEVGKGLSVALATLERTRLGAAAQAVGIAQGAIDYATSHARERIAFGKPLTEIQAIQFKLADMQTRTAAARELLYKACALADRSAPEAAQYSSMAKLFASDTAMWVTVEAVQVLGGYGYVSEYPVERMMRDAKITQIYEGTNEIQRLVIAREMTR